ncbi:MAG: rod shape-determining protein [Clostridia bacterium]
MNFFVKDIAIDLGTTNTLIHVKGKGIVLREPSIVAINNISSEVLFIGHKAKEMFGRTPDNILAVRPLTDGVIADFDATILMLADFMQKVIPKSLLSRPRVVICVPSGVTDVEERAVEEVVLKAGAKEVYLMEEPMAAAIGAGLKVDRPEGCMVVDIGGGTTEIGVLSLGGIVVTKSIRIAGDKLDESIIEYMKKNYNLLIGSTTAEEVKIKIGAAFTSMTDEKMQVKGRNLTSGLPETVTITTTNVQEAMQEVIDSIVTAVKATLEVTPPELSSDIMEQGIMLTGGGALLKNIDRYMSLKTGIPVNIHEKPLDCVTVGAGMALENIDVLKRILKAKRK